MATNDGSTELKRRRVNRFHRWVANPVMRRVAGYLPGQALLETIGRKSGRPRRTPIGGRRTGTEYWLVADHGRRSQYVRNLEANPEVRIQIHGRWHDGIAQTVPGDNTAERLRKLPRFNSMLVRALGTDVLSVRVTLRLASGSLTRSSAVAAWRGCRWSRTTATYDGF